MSRGRAALPRRARACRDRFPWRVPSPGRSPWPRLCTRGSARRAARSRERLCVLAVLVRRPTARQGSPEARSAPRSSPRRIAVCPAWHVWRRQPPDTGGRNATSSPLGKPRRSSSCSWRSPPTRSTSRNGTGRETRRRDRATRLPRCPRRATSRVSSAARAMSRSLANSLTVTRMRAASPPGAPLRPEDSRSRLRSTLRRPRRTRASRSARSASRARSRTGSRQTRRARCALAAAMTMLASPMARRPMRWCTASRTPGHSCTASSRICSSALTASGS